MPMLQMKKLTEFFSNWPTVGQLIRADPETESSSGLLLLLRHQTASWSQAKWWSLPSDIFFWSPSSSISNSQQLLKKWFHNYSPETSPGLSIYAKIRPPFQTSNWKMSRCSCFAIQHFKKSQSFHPFIKKKTSVHLNYRTCLRPLAIWNVVLILPGWRQMNPSRNPLGTYDGTKTLNLWVWCDMVLRDCYFCRQSSN